MSRSGISRTRRSPPSRYSWTASAGVAASGRSSTGGSGSSRRGEGRSSRSGSADPAWDVRRSLIHRRGSSRTMRGLVPLVLVLALLILAAPARAPLPGSMTAPSWTAGDFWDYRFNTSFGGFVWFNGTLHTEIAGAENRTVRGVAQDVYVVDTTGSGAVDASGANGTWTLTGEQLVSAGPRVVVRNLLRLDAQGTFGLGLPFGVQWTNRTETRITRNDWAYPVPLGFSGAMSLNASFVETVHVTFGRNETWTNTSLETDVGLAVSLPGTDTILVPAGSFETFVIRETWPDGSGQRFDYAPRAGNNARTRTFSGTGGEVAAEGAASQPSRRGQAPEPLGARPPPPRAGPGARVPPARSHP